MGPNIHNPGLQAKVTKLGTPIAGRMFMAWRSGPTHFASSLTKMFIVSSIDGGVTWEKEYELETSKDLREPFFLEVRHG